MNKKIMIIGGAVLDVLVRPAEPEVFSSGSYSAEEICMSTGGDALNEATVLAKLGDTPYLCTLLGEDQAGEWILEHCRRTGIQTNHIISDASLCTGINVVLVQKDGARNFLTNPQGTLRRLGICHIPEEIPKEIGIVSLASMFVSPALGIPEMETLFSRIKKQGKILCADMTKRKNGETLREVSTALSYVDYLFPNQEEAALLTEKDKAEDQAREFLSCGVKHVIIKCGALGCYLADREKGEWMRAIPTAECVDTTGAGDCFAGGFLYALSRNRSFQECARFANACGSLAVEKTGATAGIKGLYEAEQRERSGMSR
ncbi:MAG: carbohydrate kinase family protein [Eubacteriales bacterium]|nr:carbohydrate kinase family protein [Eubacteriales bacterium]